MGTLIQRRPFDHIDFAEATAAAFHEPAFAVPGITVTTNVVEQDGQVWLVLTQEGAMVINDEAVLPNYEFVSLHV